MKSFDARNNIDLAIMNFSKAYNAMSHKLLLDRMNKYVVWGQLNTWFEIVLNQRKMKTFVDGDELEETSDDSDPPQEIKYDLFSSSATLMTGQMQVNHRSDFLNLIAFYTEPSMQKDPQNLEVWDKH